MHNVFYASGFLYNLKSHKILLLSNKQTDDTKPCWSIFRGESNEGEEAQSAFQRIINELLSLNLKYTDIIPIYDYVSVSDGKKNHVFYAEIKSTPEFESEGDKSYSWVNLSDINKIIFSDNAKQDVIVGERVINLKKRIALNIQ